MDEVHLQFMHASNIEITLIFINMHAERHGKPVNYSDAMCLIQRLFTIPVHCRWGCSHQSILIEKFNSLKLSPHEHNHNWSPSLDSVFPFLSLSLSQSLFFQLPCHYENENTKQKLLSIYIVMNAAFWFRAIILPLQIAHTRTIGVQSVKKNRWCNLHLYRSLFEKLFRQQQHDNAHQKWNPFCIFPYNFSYSHSREQ